MPKLISITSGSKSILTKVINRYPEHQLNLYKSITENNFQLIDWFTDHVVFTLPLSYQLVQSSASLKTGPLLNLIFLTLDHKQLKILSAYVKNQLNDRLPSNMTSLFMLQGIKDPSKIIVGSSWTSNTEYFKWTKQSFITRFFNDANTESFHNNLVKIR